METETLKTNLTPCEEDWSRNGSLFTIDLPVIIEKMKHEHNWENGELNSKVLLKCPERKVVLTVLHEGTEIDSFQSDDSLTLQIIEGEIKFHTREDSIIMTKGQLLTIYDNIKYSLITKTDTAFLLTIENGIYLPTTD